MLGFVLAVFAMAFFAGIITAIAKLSGRSYPGQVTEPLGNEIDYDDPYPGWGNRLLGLNRHYEKRLAQPPAVPFEEWADPRSH